MYRLLAAGFSLLLVVPASIALTPPQPASAGHLLLRAGLLRPLLLRHTPHHHAHQHIVHARRLPAPADF